MKKKLDELTKAKLIYSGELLVIAIIFLVIAILKITGVIPHNDVRSAIFTWVTLFGSSWAIIDFIWALVSQTRRPKVSLLDKSLHVLAAIYIFGFDLFVLITKPTDTTIYRFGLPIAILYLCACYIFEAVYHFYHPLPALLNAIKEEEVPEVVDEQKAEFVEEQKEENKDEIK